MVTIIKVGKSQCQLSGKTAEGVVCKFNDRPKELFVSWNEFKKLCRWYSGTGRTEQQQTE